MEITKITDPHFDAVVVGGGMVGSVQALALLEQGKRVLLLERQLPSVDWLAKPPLRVSAINLFSQDYLEQLGVWAHIALGSKNVFKRLATWDKPMSRLEFNADEIEHDHLGHLIRNEAIQLAGFDALKPYVQSAQLMLSDAALNRIETRDRDVCLHLSDPSGEISVSATLLIGADGANSKVRQLAHIGTSGWDYQQHCLSITIKTDFGPQDITWQEFQPSGPKAFLPLADGYASLIWYDAPNNIKQLKTLPDTVLKTKIIETFPDLPGDFVVVQHASFPLTRRQAKRYFSGRIVLVGDAAHTINPLAGQGVNLGFKDVAELSSILKAVDWNDSEKIRQALVTYQQKRKLESCVMSGVMDLCYQLFSNSGALRQTFRNQFLSLANQSRWAKVQVLKKAVGL